MKGLYVKKNLSADYAMLYQLSRKVKLSRELRNLLREQVRYTRAEILRANPQHLDKLKSKLECFGNKGNWARAKVEELERVIFRSKKPINESVGQWCSIELECIMPNKSAEKSFITYVRNKKYTNSITIKDDGSLRSNTCGCGEYDDCETCFNARDAYGREVIVTCKIGEWDMLIDVCNKLQSVGCYVNKSCGLHVHFDCRNYTARQVSTLGKRIARCVPALKQVLPRSRQNNSFCAAPINTHSTNSNRYAFVNLQSFRKHNTLEIRGHSGSLDSKKIINWIRTMRVIMHKRNMQDVNTVHEMLAKFGFETDLALFLMERYEKFTRNRNTVSSDDVADDQEAA